MEKSTYRINVSTSKEIRNCSPCLKPPCVSMSFPYTPIIGALDFNLLSLCPNIRIRILNLANSICDIEQFALVSGKESG